MINMENAVGSSYDDELYGDDNDNILTGGGGNDTLEGGNGNDEYIFDSGEGQDFIDDDDGTDFIHFGAGISEEDLSFQYLTGGDLEMSISGSSDTITINSHDNTGTKQIEKIVFSDKSELLLTTTENGTSGDDVITGTVGSDVLNGSGGNDVISGLLGKDTLIWEMVMILTSIRMGWMS